MKEGVFDTTKGEDPILGFDSLNHFNPSIDWRKGFITFDTDYKDSSDSSIHYINDFSTATTCESLVGDSRTPSFTYSVNITPLNSPHYLLIFGDEVFREGKDVGENNPISSLNFFHGNVDLPPSSYPDSLEELWVEEAEPEET
ncbi:hypothetical protein O181_026213 [Austropuccinia psidii MF-1]|uniref:Uncharacterized protein n=1 Tax=Austropuccinia psidii MF-1 TaxID=1389203 RepID=A0A9Q3CM46_9BASI|nr:hypothetical protein [Austropuccinia psidii MF-1]